MNLYDTVYEDFKNTSLSKLSYEEVKELTGDLPLLIGALKGNYFQEIDNLLLQYEKEGKIREVNDLLKLKEKTRGLFAKFWKAIEIKQHRGVQSLLRVINSINL